MRRKWGCGLQSRTGPQHAAQRETSYRLVKGCCLPGGTSDLSRQNSASYRPWGRDPSEGGAKGLRLEWELRSGTHRALPSQSALAGVPHLLLITNCSVIFSHYHGDGRPSILSSSRMQLDHLSPGLSAGSLSSFVYHVFFPVYAPLIHSLLCPFIHSFLPHTSSLHSFICSLIHFPFFPPSLPHFTAPGSPQIGNDGQ